MSEQDLYDNEYQFKFNNYLVDTFSDKLRTVLDVYIDLELIRIKIKSEIERGIKALENALTKEI
jgi:hypothetical protein